MGQIKTSNLFIFLAVILISIIAITASPLGLNNNQFLSPINTLDIRGTTLTAAPVFLNTSDFKTYTYGGDPVQEPNAKDFFFLFPSSTRQGQLAGSDALSLNPYMIQKLDFDATFKIPKTHAAGFDEMVVFAASDTAFYNNDTEFGIRLDLNDASVYGYVQEPKGINGDNSFLMLKLMHNDGITHHYTIMIHGSRVSFYIDSIYHGRLSFPSGTDYSNLTFSILAVVHRFTDVWDSAGDNMTVGNFSLNVRENTR